MTRSMTFSIGEFYHVYNRGVEKRKIFLSDSDYKRFVALLHLCNSTDPVHIDMRRTTLDEILDTSPKNRLVDVGAYCLMPNHFHLLLHESREDGISQFMHKLTTAYTMYFNKKNNRNGRLFQGVFKAEHANKNEYLKYLFGYVHLNPIKLVDSKWKDNGIKNKTSAKNFLEKYEYSSYPEYAGLNRKEKVILSPKSFPGYFDKKTDFKKMISFWLEFRNDEE